MILDRAITLPSSIFRAYDIRGIVGDTLTEAGVSLIGKAFGSLLHEKGVRQVAVACDGRVSGPAMLDAFCHGLLSTGCDVADVGMVPTPLLYYVTHILEEHAGVMVTGSHNPPNYNGLKMVVNGVALTGQEIQSLYHRIQDRSFHEGQGVRHELEIIERYLSHVARTIRLSRPLKMVVDAGNGVTGQLAPVLFRRLGCEVIELFCDIDGRFPNHHADPSQPENLQDLIRSVRETGADIGLAFDGDGDRLGVVTSRGDIIWPDRLLMVFAKEVLETCCGAKVIYDVKCTHHLGELVKSLGGQPIMWKTGHSLIKAKMAEMQAPLGGEMSGHFFFKDRWYGFDDALYAGARLLEVISQYADPAAPFCSLPDSVNTPEMKIAVADEEKFDLMQRLMDCAVFATAKDILTIDGLRVNFADGWGLLRPSNTSPYLITRFEASNDNVLEQIQQRFREWILSVKPDLALPF